jgi:DNA-binding LacI/PurR family transcriptional regulator
VFFDRDSDEIHASKVMVDNEQSAYEAVKHLLENGCKRIAFLAGPKNVSVSNQRRLGYLRALVEAGIQEDDSLIIHSDYFQDTATSQTHELMMRENRPDGILVVSDRLALGVLVGLRELKIRVPEDVKIVSFNNEPICGVVSPTISSVAQPLEEIGKLAMKLILDQIEGRSDCSEPVIEVLKTKLIIRESSQKIN